MHTFRIDIVNQRAILFSVSTVCAVAPVATSVRAIIQAPGVAVGSHGAVLSVDAFLPVLTFLGPAQQDTAVATNGGHRTCTAPQMLHNCTCCVRTEVLAREQYGGVFVASLLCMSSHKQGAAVANKSIQTSR